MDLHLLSRDQADGMLQAGQAILDPSGYWLTTRTAEYVRKHGQAVYHRVYTGLRVVHRNGHRWDVPLRRFVPCDCVCCEDGIAVED